MVNKCEVYKNSKGETEIQYLFPFVHSIGGVIPPRPAEQITDEIPSEETLNRIGERFKGINLTFN